MDRFFEDVRINRAALDALPIYVGDIDMHDMVEHQETSIAIWRIHAAHTGAKRSPLPASNMIWGLPKRIRFSESPPAKPRPNRKVRPHKVTRPTIHNSHLPS